MNRSILITTCILILSASLVAQKPKDPSRWTPEDIIFQERVSSPSFSPDNSAIVWTKRRPFKEKDKFISDLYLTRLDLEKDGMPRTIRLTSTDENDYSPLFSKDGENIYFLSSREKGKKLWKMSIYGGEPEEVHEFKNGISSIRWKDEKTLLFVSNDGKTLYEEEKKKDNTIVVEDSVHWKISRIYAFDISSKKITRITNNKYPIASWEVSRDGQLLITQLRMSPHYTADGQPKPRTYLHRLDEGTRTQILQDYQEPGAFRFTASNNGFYFLAIKSSDPEWNGAGISELYYYELSDNQIAKIQMDWKNGISSYRIVGENVLGTLPNGPTFKAAMYIKGSESWNKQEIDFGQHNDHVIPTIISEDGTQFIYMYSTASKLPEYYVSQLELKRKKYVLSGTKEFVRLNKKLSKKPIAKSEIFRWTGANEEEVNGILYYPENYEAGKKYPLMLSIHGGPTGVDTDTWSERWSTYPQIYSQKGAFTLKPNYHGSGNHSLEFIESIKNGVYYDLEEIDIINGIEALNQKGLIDMDQLGVMGWSNGAILATMLTLRHPEMFKAAAPGAGDVNWTSDYGTCRFGVTFDQSYFGGAPWDDVNGKTYNEVYIIKSPLFEIEKIRTPTIIFHGSKDRAVPRDQGWEYYRGLQQVGKAPVRFLWFPEQPHGLQKITHQLRKMNEEIRWFDTYLFKTYEPKNEAYKNDSPLAMALKMDSVAKTDDGLFGAMVSGKLIPEMVSTAKDSIEISRFEVTNAQYQSYNPDHDFPVLKANYPVVGLGDKEIRDYLAWLSETTGEVFRLPNMEEGKKLHEKARKIGAKENTMNYWAGYEITLDEVRQLQPKLEELQSDLIKEVGSYKPTMIKEATVYDLGGNASELYSTGSELIIYGFSAYDYVDPMSDKGGNDRSNAGIRLIK